ncbi:hypothetical protein HC723_11665 [Vibrio sp. S11_S32]|uniref:hypothetical protein n=1 Tax=Vibrio sp. S11_S32 TaxID=2720225 RepID=UPI001681B3BB|nr:hypothetical protein [Vibrio sp. S11_S32]MBD1577089.1 hypothetical protein [Vibrio sp. S11_S32]
MRKNTLTTSICTKAFVTLSPLFVVGCATPPAPKVVAPKPEYFSAKEGDSIKAVSTDLAKRYHLKAIRWEDAKLDDATLQLPIKIDVHKVSAQEAFDEVYVQTSYLTDVNMDSGVVGVEQFDVSDPNKHYTVIPEPIVKPKQIKTVRANGNPYNNEKLVSDHSVANGMSGSVIAGSSKNSKAGGSNVGSTSSGSNGMAVAAVPVAGSANKESSTNKNVGASDAQGNKTNKADKKKAIAMNDHNYYLSAEDSYSSSIRKALAKEKYHTYWSLTDDTTAKALKRKPTKAETISAENAGEFAQKVTAMVNEVNTGNKLFLKTNNLKKTAMFHQNGTQDDVAIFTVKRGRLSENVQALAEHYGWTLNIKTGWLADVDYPISVDYPLVSADNLPAALVKLVGRYSRLKPKMLESKQEVYIINVME